MPDDLFIEAPDGTITKYLAMFKNIFNHTENICHYNMMMGIGEDIIQEIVVLDMVGEKQGI